MTIKEAFARNIPSSTLKIGPPERLEQYRKILLERGIAMLEQAGIPGLLEELQDKIKPYSVVRIPAEPDAHPPLATAQNRTAQLARLDEGAVVLDIGWNYQATKRDPETICYSAIRVLAEPLSENLLIEGKETQVIPCLSWNSDKGKLILEDALVYAFYHPANYQWPPIAIY